MTWTNNQKVVLAATAVISAAVGAGVATLASAKVYEKRFQERLEKEIQDAKEFYQEFYSKPTLVEEPSVEERELLNRVKDATDEVDGIPEDAVGRALSAVSKYRGEDDEEESARRAPVIVNNIFQSATPPGDAVMEALLRDRDPSAPYIITKEEFLENEPEFEQASFTFWEGDGILVDDREEMNPIMRTDLVAGDDNLRRFGYGSDDEDVVYIRNETLDPPMDLHITRSSGKYSVEVMAFDDDEPHLQHSQPRKFRHQDE